MVERALNFAGEEAEGELAVLVRDPYAAPSVAQSVVLIWFLRQRAVDVEEGRREVERRERVVDQAPDAGEHVLRDKAQRVNRLRREVGRFCDAGFLEALL